MLVASIDLARTVATREARVNRRTNSCVLMGIREIEVGQLMAQPEVCLAPLAFQDVAHVESMQDWLTSSPPPH